MNSYLVNIDTASLQNSVTKVAGNPFQCTYKFSSPHRKVSCVALRNAQIPIGFYNVRAPYNTITICKAVSTVADTLTLNSVAYTVPPNIYTLDGLINVLNGLIASVGTFSVVKGFVVLTTASTATFTVSGTANDLWKLLGFVNSQSGTPSPITATNAPQTTFNIGGVTRTLPANTYTASTLVTGLNAISGISGTFSIDIPTNRFVFTPTSGSSTIAPVGIDLCYMTGFTNQSGTSITATNRYNMTFDPYIRIHIENLNVPSTETNPCTFKIPVSYGSDGVVFWNELSQNSQQNVVLASASHIDRLNIRVYDRFGTQIDNNGLDWAMTLELLSNN